MLGRDYARQNCSVARALEVVGERWTLLILRDAFFGVTRFDLWQRRLRIAPNILARRLDALVEAGVLARERYQERPERFDYRLTPRGKDLFPVILGLLSWGDANRAPDGPPGAGRARRLRRAGQPRGPAARRAGARSTRTRSNWHWGPGSGRPPGAAPAAAPGAGALAAEAGGALQELVALAGVARSSPRRARARRAASSARPSRASRSPRTLGSRW